MSAAQRLIRRLLADADIEVNGWRPWDPQVFDSRLYGRVVSQGTLGLGNAFVDGWWDVEALDEFITRIFDADIDARIRGRWPMLAQTLVAGLANLQNRSRSERNVRSHYDLGNDLYQCMLDRRLVYSCGYWADAGTLDEAQEAKLDLVCRKLGMRREHRILDIGCGWGSWARFAAERYGSRVTGITLSPAQVELGGKLCRGLPVDLRLQDYRAIEGRYDRIVSIGMFEHVGVRNYRRFMTVVHDHLERDGLFLLHTIGGSESLNTTDPWLHHHVFPNSMLPSARQVAAATEGLFVIEDWQNFGADYDRTLMEWWRNFDSHWQRLAPRYGERFRRRWKFYLQVSAGSFRARRNQVWQIVLSPRGVRGGYRPVRHDEREPSARLTKAVADRLMA